MPGVAVTKMHGAYNDFGIVDCRNDSSIESPSETARIICDRRGGIGCDGLLLIEPSATAHARMRIFNADGSEAEMCGNGLRCVVRYLFEAEEGRSFAIETASGVTQGEVLSSGDPFTVRVMIGSPVFENRSLPFPDADFVRVGNEHVVIFVRSIDAIDLRNAAELLRATFPDGVNVHLAVPAGEHAVEARHYERGAGTTHACGSGAVACAAAAIRRGLATSPVEVHVPGGVLTVEWTGHGDAALSGPAVRVFDTMIALPRAAAV